MLTLPIKKKWFDMICAGEKKEEYRAITPYYIERFKNIGLLNQFGEPTGKEACIVLRNGYGKNMPEVTVSVEAEIGFGCPAWGAEPGTPYYILKIKERYA